MHNKIWPIHKLQSTSIVSEFTKVASTLTVKREAEAVSATFTKAFEFFATQKNAYNGGP